MKNLKFVTIIYIYILDDTHCGVCRLFPIIFQMDNAGKLFRINRGQFNEMLWAAAVDGAGSVFLAKLRVRFIALNRDRKKWVWV